MKALRRLTMLAVALAASVAHAGDATLPDFAWGTARAAVREALPKGFGACHATDGTPFGTEACPVAVEGDRLSPFATWLYFRDGALVGWVVRSDPADRMALVAALRERFGAPTEESDARIAWRGAVAVAWTSFALRDGDFDATYAVTLDALVRAPADREAARVRAELQRRGPAPPATPRAEERTEDPGRRPGADESSVAGKRDDPRRQRPLHWLFGR